MKKTISFALSFLFITLFLVACGGGKTAQEYLEDEKKAIKRFMNKHDYSSTSSYPDGDFKENQFYKNDDGFYMHVTDSGSSKRATMGQTVLIRFDYCYDIIDYMDGDTVKYTYTQDRPFEMKYGVSATYSTPICEGFAVPLSHVGEGAMVDIIIPSKLGSLYDNQNYRPRFYKNVRYTKFTYTPGV